MKQSVDGTAGLLDDSLTGNNPMQCAVYDPAKQQVPINMAVGGAVSAAGTRVFKRGTGADYNLLLPRPWMLICITPSLYNLKAWWNDDTTKTFTLFGGQENVRVFHPGATKLTIATVTTHDPSVEVVGM